MSFAVIEKSNVTDFNITKSPELFNRENIGGLYLEPDANLEEISQNVLKKLISNSFEYNQDLPYGEFISEDIFIEKSSNNLTDAKKFVRKTFSKLKLSGHYSKTDILNNLTFFYSFFNLKKVNCRFEILSSNSCKKFHIDHINARLISTYAGPGTEVKSSTNSEVLNLPSGSSIIVKGSSFPNFKPVTLHRSPQIDGTGTKRFLFIADF